MAASEQENILKNLRTLQEQVALFDRIHSIRVKHIQVLPSPPFTHAPAISKARHGRAVGAPC